MNIVNIIINKGLLYPDELLRFISGAPFYFLVSLKHISAKIGHKLTNLMKTTYCIMFLDGMWGLPSPYITVCFDPVVCF